MPGIEGAEDGREAAEEDGRRRRAVARKRLRPFDPRWPFSGRCESRKRAE